ncbi:hypothetical protein HY493_00665 [Candidatus Woesearchaeota archaeon]|nr:hypothetical protein [Candidatus Woesearchaeota archaeon]
MASKRLILSLQPEFYRILEHQARSQFMNVQELIVHALRATYLKPKKTGRPGKKWSMEDYIVKR